MTRSSLRLLAIAALAAALTACAASAAGPTPAGGPPVDEAAATEMARTAFEGYNSGDYQVWARDWSDTMRGAITADDFAKVREQLMAGVGRFVSIDGVTYAESKPGIHRYTFQVTFEKGAASVWFGFISGSPKIEGVTFE
jgi:opacity protein-like surface antigen